MTSAATASTESRKDGGVGETMPVSGSKTPADIKSQLISGIAASPLIRNAHLTAQTGEYFFGDKSVSLDETVKILAVACEQMQNGTLALQKSTLVCQATALDALFTMMAERAIRILESQPEIADKFMKLAFKAQANCRTTIEVLDRMAREGTQIIKHVHVDNRGGQTVIADTIAAGGANEKSEKQCHATGLQPVHDALLLGDDPQGNGVPLPSSNREKTLQDARRDKPRRSERQPKRP